MVRLRRVVSRDTEDDDVRGGRFRRIDRCGQVRIFLRVSFCGNSDSFEDRDTRGYSFWLAVSSFKRFDRIEMTDSTQDNWKIVF